MRLNLEEGKNGGIICAIYYFRIVALSLVVCIRPDVNVSHVFCYVPQYAHQGERPSVRGKNLGHQFRYGEYHLFLERVEKIAIA